MSSEKLRTLFSFHRIEKTKKKTHDRLDKFNQKKYEAKKKKLREIGEKVFVSVKRIQQKSAPGKFYKQTVKNSKNNKFLIKTFQKHELFAVKNNFI